MANIVTTQNFSEEVLKSDKPVVVDVYATWCGPCKMMAPLFEQLAQEKTEYKFVKVNIDDERDLAVQYNVSSIPSFLFFKDGKLVGKEMGYMSKDALTTKLKNHLG
jgi:thioredoxin 1